jgi:hypothetical protein
MGQKGKLIPALRERLTCAKGIFLKLQTILLLAFPVTVQGQFTYYTNNSTIIIDGYTGSDGAVSIPDTIDDLPVTGFTSSTFMNSAVLTSVTIGSNVLSIRNYAFSSCTNLTDVIISAGVTDIGWYAFERCSSLSSVTMGTRVTNIATYAFRYCSNLVSITIPDSVTSLGDETFYSCTSLTNAVIGNGLASIGKYVFYRCTSLVNVAIGLFQRQCPCCGLLCILLEFHRFLLPARNNRLVDIT